MGFWATSILKVWITRKTNSKRKFLENRYFDSAFLTRNFPETLLSKYTGLSFPAIATYRPAIN